MTTDYLAHALQKRISSVSDNFARLSCTRECNRLLAFLTTSSMCAFQVRLVPIVSTSMLDGTYNFYFFSVDNNCIQFNWIPGKRDSELLAPCSVKRLFLVTDLLLTLWLRENTDSWKKNQRCRLIWAYTFDPFSVNLRKSFLSFLGVFWEEPTKLIKNHHPSLGMASQTWQG